MVLFTLYQLVVPRPSSSYSEFHQTLPILWILLLTELHHFFARGIIKDTTNSECSIFKYNCIKSALQNSGFGMSVPRIESPSIPFIPKRARCIVNREADYNLVNTYIIYVTRKLYDDVALLVAGGVQKGDKTAQFGCKVQMGLTQAFISASTRDLISL